MQYLPPEIIYHILTFIPGYEIGNFCATSIVCNIVAQHRRRKMILVHKVRTRMLSYIIQMMHRHFHYTKWDGGKYLNITYTLPALTITSLADFRRKKSELLELWNESADTISHCCDCCGTKLGWSYYILDGEDPAPPITIFIYIYCYACYHRGVLGFYDTYKRLPSKAGDHRHVQIIAVNNQHNTVPNIPNILTKYFRRMEGGVYNFLRK